MQMNTLTNLFVFFCVSVCALCEVKERNGNDKGFATVEMKRMGRLEVIMKRLKVRGKSSEITQEDIF